MTIDEVQHQITTLALAIEIREADMKKQGHVISLARSARNRMEAAQRADLREMRRLRTALEKLEDEAIDKAIDSAISENRRPGITEFAAEVRRLLTGEDGGVPHDADAIAKMLYTEARIQVHLQASDRSMSEENPHLGGTNLHYLPRTLNRLVFGLEGDVTP